MIQKNILRMLRKITSEGSNSEIKRAASAVGSSSEWSLPAIGFYVLGLLGGFGSLAMIPPGRARGVGLLLIIVMVALPPLAHALPPLRKRSRLVVRGIIILLVPYAIILAQANIVPPEEPPPPPTAGSGEGPSLPAGGSPPRGLVILHPNSQRNTNIWLSKPGAQEKLAAPFRTRMISNTYGIDPATIVPTFGDLDGDGISDIGIAQPNGDRILFFVTRGHANESFLAPRDLRQLQLPQRLPRDAKLSLLNGDFNSDGLTDLLLLSVEPSGTSWSILPNGAGPAGSSSWISGRIATRLQLSDKGGPAVGDFEGSGKDSVVALSRSPGSEVSLVELSLTSEETPTLSTRTLPANSSPDSLLVAGDFDGNGQSEVLTLKGGESGVSVAALNWTSSRSEDVRVIQYADLAFDESSTPVPLATLKIASHDFNSDGRSELVALKREPDDGIRVFQSNSDFTNLHLSYELTRESVGWSWSLSRVGVAN